MKIIYEDDTQRAEVEAYYKEYRNDIIVEINGSKYRIYVTTMTRLIQDYETEIEAGEYYMMDPNIVIVKEVTKNTIEKTLEYQASRKYFDKLNNHGFKEPWYANTN